MADMSGQASGEDHKLRPFYCELNVLSRPDGSAIVTQGETAAIAGVYGPIEVKPNKIHIEKATVEGIYRPKSGLPCVSDRLCETTLQNTFEAAVLTSQYPRTLISISVQEMQDSGGLLACAINAGCLALMNSGLSMKFLVAAVHCMINKTGEVILDPDNKQLKDSCASLMFAFDNVDKNIVSSSTHGRFTEAQYQEALLRCRTASTEIFQLYRDMVKKYAPTMG
ncbi:hypothetical protein FOCC_FOCC008209 [Frankliniella occidentalis]|uniref:Exosome complex component RRP46 n=1 Tax=Frankliniella occidentalis TaxID=133901 RepID=A0A6J1TNA0_FRAOC|nr:exosome complex component RRP46 [Frankliniella occidentalis]KAE8745143.1 hypothetical protein FOCC_FOCC008209 [Frankliniella occidentalis]